MYLFIFVEFKWGEKEKCPPSFLSGILFFIILEYSVEFDETLPWCVKFSKNYFGVKKSPTFCSCVTDHIENHSHFTDSLKLSIFQFLMLEM